MEKLQLNENIRRERGAITLFVLIACLFFVFILTGVYLSLINRSQVQEQEVQQIKENYAKNINRIDEIYEELAKNAIVTLRQESVNGIWTKEVALIGNARIPEVSTATIVGYIFNQESTENNVSNWEWETVIGNNIKELVDIRKEGVTENGIYYFWIKDSEGQVYKSNEVQVTNIDRTAPQVTFEPNGGTIIIENESIDISSTIIVNDIGEIESDALTYAWSQDKNHLPTDWKIFENGQTVKKEKITTEQIWYICAQVTDKAGNTTTAWSEPFIVEIHNYEIIATGEKKATLAEAVKEVSDSQIIKVLRSNVDTSDVIINKNVQIDTNEKTITRDKTITISENVSVDLYGNGTITSNDSSAIFSNYGRLEIENTNINIEDGGNAVYNATETSTVSVSGESNIRSHGYPAIYNYGKTEITGGTITAESSNAINNREGATLRIDGTSNIHSSDSVTIYNSGATEITGGTIMANRNYDNHL